MPRKTSHDHAIPDADRDGTIQRMPEADIAAPAHAALSPGG